MLLYIIRHADPVYETDSLTERGKMQAEAVGKRLARLGIDRIFSSPMGRAKMTAEPAARLLGLPVNIEPWAHEIEDERLFMLPDGTKKSIYQIENTVFRRSGNIDLGYESALSCTGIRDSRIGEAIDYIAENGNDFLSRLGYKHEDGAYRIVKPSDERVALFCHAAMMRAWFSTLLHFPFHLAWGGFATTHTGVTVLEFKNNESGFTAPRCLCFSDISHLYAEGLDSKHDNGVII